MLWLSRSRQSHDERSSRLPSGGGDVSCDASCEAACECEAESCTVSVRPAGVASPAGLEDLLLFVIVAAGAVVGDAVDDGGVLAGDGDVDGAAPVAAGVLEYGLQDAFGEFAVDAEPNRAV